MLTPIVLALGPWGPVHDGKHVTIINGGVKDAMFGFIRDKFLAIAGPYFGYLLVVSTKLVQRISQCPRKDI